MMMFSSMFFLLSIQPMLMIISLILITLMYSLFIFKFMGTYWFSYALVMVMLSGVLVVFTYMVSLIPNESFEVYNLIIIVIFMMFMMLDYWFYEYFNDYSYISLNLWMSYIGFMNMFLVSFLLSLMIMVIWLSCMNKGAVKVM